MIDAHCHLNASYTNENEVAPIIDSFRKKGGEKIIDVATNRKETAVSQQLAMAFPTTIYCNVGLHPETPDGKTESWDTIYEDFAALSAEIGALKNLVGIGETGLDYSYKDTHGDLYKEVLHQQNELFVLHIELAKRHNLPLVIHARGEHQQDYTVYSDVLEILNREKFGGEVYFHSFGGSRELAVSILEKGYVLGVNGIITYSGAKLIAECIQYVPLETLLLETDAPFLIPSNLNRNELQTAKTNEPIGIFATAARISKLKNIDIMDVLHRCKENTTRVFERIL